MNSHSELRYVTWRLVALRQGVVDRVVEQSVVACAKGERSVRRVVDTLFGVQILTMGF